MTDHLASWFRRRELYLETEAMIANAVQQGTDAPDHPNIAKLPGDPRGLRGIPVVGVYGGIGGAIPGTKPGTSAAFR